MHSVIIRGKSFRINQKTSANFFFNMDKEGNVSLNFGKNIIVKKVQSPTWLQIYTMKNNSNQKY